ncbi:ABC transporter ATP-binding protein [Butyrivibrio sp. NC3005]|uniref:ABC transporter ATP-binding protein n=1 Tax=Butyrivibrio sp. NC3005 TaxID=1280685 RepID=UPI0003FDD363|nr:ABC transporter ATP-binding protein [Butyrivibrio sp. NC3005]
MEKRSSLRFKNVFSLLMYFLKGSKHLFAATVVFSCMTSFIDLINPRFIGFAVDVILGNDIGKYRFTSLLLKNDTGADFLKKHMYIVALCVLAFSVLGGFCRYLVRLFNTMGAEKLVKRMRDSLSDHIMHLPYAWYGTVQTGDIIQRCTSDVETIKMFVSEQLVNFFRIVMLMILALSFMAGISVKLTLISGAFIPVIVLYSVFFHGKIGDAFEHVDIQEGKLSAIVQENLTGVRVVRAFGRESYEKDRFDKQNEYYTNMWIRMLKLLSAFWASNDLISGLQIFFVVIFGAIFCVHGQMSAGQYVSFIAYNAILTWPVRMLGRVITEMSRAGISGNRILEIMNTQVEHDIESPKRPPLDKDILFEHVSFSYDNENDILSDVSFEVKAGSCVGILGSTGSGKSTLMYLLDRLYNLPKENGKITIGGVDILDIEAEYLRENIGIVLQEPYLFSRTLADNIAITQNELKMDNIYHTAHTAFLDEAVEKFTKGYDTFVGERGVTLSGGQKQRVAIAQTLMKNAKILIFDDSLSAVDANTDAKIREALNKEMKGTTVFLIAHRITTLMNADNILVMQNGRIKESGTHEILLEKGGIYKKIYDLQTQGMEE